MSQTATKMKLVQASILARAIADEFGTGCERVEVAGSVRRCKAEAGDLKIVAVPRRGTDLLGAPADSLLDPIIDNLVRAGRLQAIKGGEKYKQFLLPRHGIKLDLFLAQPDNFGLIFLLRTGPAEFSQRMVTPRRRGGHMPSIFKVSEGFVRKSGRALSTPEEADVFHLWDMEFIEPWERA